MPYIFFLMLQYNLLNVATGAATWSTNEVKKLFLVLRDAKFFHMIYSLWENWKYLTSSWPLFVFSPLLRTWAQVGTNQIYKNFEFSQMLSQEALKGLIFGLKGPVCVSMVTK